MLLAALTYIYTKLIQIPDKMRSILFFAAIIILLFSSRCLSQNKDSISDRKYLQFTFLSNDCDDIRIDGIYIHGFDSAALGRVKIKRYFKKTNFQQLVDSFYKYNIYAHRDKMDSLWKISYISTDSFISSAIDFEIIVSDTVVYKFSDILVGKVKHGPGKYVCDIIAWKLNDLEQVYGTFKIEKPGWDEEAKIIGEEYFKWRKEYGEEWANTEKELLRKKES